jgi:hypothetical protein
MPNYWTTFRIASDAGYDTRCQSLLDAMIDIRNDSWTEPTSFWAFSSSLDLDGVIGAMSTGLRADRDLLVVGQIDSAALRYFGQLEHPDLFMAFFPAATKLL